ncbi:MAG: glycosyltransferase [Alphaproteobacteria bacterium]
MSASPHRDIIFDMRCLQDEAYRTRGVGKVAETILIRAKEYLETAKPAEKWRFTGLIASDLPDLSPEHRIAVDAIRHSAPREPGPSATFVNLSPMTHDPLFVARLVNDPNVLSAAVCYDFIPLAEPERYLPGLAERLGYSLSMYWLACHRFFAPISEATASELGERLAIPPSEIVNMGAPLAPSFITQNTRTPQHSNAKMRRSVLVIGGGDERKNVECAIRAHAQSTLLRRKKIDLVITGNYPRYWRDDLLNKYIIHGGSPRLLTFAGHVDQNTLVKLYRHAYCVVCMSRAEGFSLPLIEAMACDTPVIASDIPAHSELIKLPNYLLPCNADAELCQLLEHLWQDKYATAEFVKTHQNVWPRFTAKNVAKRFWSALLEHMETADSAAPSATAINSPTVSRRHRPRIAFITPLPPVRSGVADYSAACLKELAKICDVTVYTNTPSPSPIEDVASIRPISVYAHLAPEYDRVVSVMGNSHFHLDIFQHLIRYGGACIQHDNRLLGFYGILLGKERAESVAANELQRPLQKGELDGWLAEESKLEATLLGELAAVSDPLFMHSINTAKIVQDRFNIKPNVLPFSIYRHWAESDFAPAQRLQARERLGISQSEVAIVSFGFIHKSKAPMDCISALELLRSWGVPAKLYFVGKNDELHNTYLYYCNRLGISESVKFTADYTSETIRVTVTICSQLIWECSSAHICLVACQAHYWIASPWGYLPSPTPISPTQWNRLHM